MEVVIDRDGSFTFEFSNEEKDLGVKMLQSLKPDCEDSRIAIELSIIEVKAAGTEVFSDALN
jgi:hypothetical protein